MPTANAPMIILARESRGYTQSALAQKMGISQAQLSKVENAQVEPTAELISLLTQHLAYPTSFFSAGIDRRSLPLPFYRKRKLRPALTRQIEANLNILRLHVRTLTRSVDIPENRVPRVDLEESGRSPEAMAQDLRIQWHVPPGPIENVTRVLEKNGVLVMKAEFDTPKVDAVSLFSIDDDLPPIIFINHGVPGDRLRFTLVHELAHILLHHHLVLPPPDCESEANAFASEFLLPAKEIRPYLSLLTLQKLARLKGHWKVSMQALIMRAAALGRISDRQKRSWFTRMGTLGFRKQEPIDIAREEPSLIRDIIDVHLKDLGYSESQLAATLHLVPDEFRKQYVGRLSLSLVGQDGRA